MEPRLKELFILMCSLLAVMCMLAFCANHVQAYDPKLEQIRGYTQQDYYIVLDGYTFVVEFQETDWNQWNIVFHGYDSQGNEILYNEPLGGMVYQNGCAILSGGLMGCLPVFGFNQFRIFCNPLILNQYYN